MAQKNGRTLIKLFISTHKVSLASSSNGWTTNMKHEICFLYIETKAAAFRVECVKRITSLEFLRFDSYVVYAFHKNEEAEDGFQID